MLGRSTISITLDLYSHAAPAMHREAAQQFRRPSEARRAGFLSSPPELIVVSFVVKLVVSA